MKIKSILAIILFLSFITGASAQESQEAQQSRQSRQPRHDRRADGNAFLPGISAAFLKPFEINKYYWGGNFHYSFLQGVSTAKKPESFGGYLEIYTEIGFYKEQNSPFNDDIFFSYLLGINLSFEKFLDEPRYFLIPYFGAKLGGLYTNYDGGGFLIEPVLGMVLLYTAYININYDASLFLNTANLRDYIGVQHSFVINFNL